MTRRTFIVRFGCASAGLGVAALVGARRYGWLARRILVHVRLLPEPANLLRNADFTRCTTPGVPDGWGSNAPMLVQGWPGRYDLRDDSPVPGARCLRLANPGGAPVRLESHDASFELCDRTSRPLTFSVYLRTDGEACPVELRVQKGAVRLVTPGPAWRRYSVSSATPVNAGGCRTGLGASISLPRSGAVRISAPQLQLGARVTSFTRAAQDERPLPDAATPPAELTITGSALPHCLRLNGTPTLVHGIMVDDSEWPDSRWQLQSIREQGFNTVVWVLPVPGGGAWTEAELRHLEERFHHCRSHGLGVIPYVSPDPNATATQIWSYVRRLLERFRSHPALLAWLLVDEPGTWWEAPPRRTHRQLAQLVRSARRADSEHPIMINENRWAAGKGGYAGLDLTDVGSVDSYPIGHYGNPGDVAGPLAARVSGDSHAAGKPAAFWLQLVSGGQELREPRPEEARALAYVSFIVGVRLLLHWMYRPASGELWRSLGRTNSELDRLFRATTVPGVRWLGTGTVQRSVYYSRWEVGGARLVALCNATPEPIGAVIPVGERAETGRQRLESWYPCTAKPAVPGTDVQVSLQPYERMVLQAR